MSDIPWNLAYFREASVPAPVALPATNISESGFLASWTAVATAERYRLDVALDEDFVTFVPGFENRLVAGLSQVVNGLEAQTSYWYRVRSENALATSPNSNVIETFTDFIEAPVALEATDIADDGFVANWEDVADAVGYHLEISADEDFETLLPLGARIAVGNVLSYQVSGLAPDSPFFYRVIAEKASGTLSAPSNVIDVVTLELFTAQGGDTVLYDGTYSTHIFDNSGDFEVLTGLRRVRRLIVGGGGQGGGVNGSGVSCGGGGGGGVIDLEEIDRPAIGVDVYPIVVGDAGDTAGALNVGEDGGDSSFDGDTAQGGGHGGSAGSNVGDGGSGGGATNSAGNDEQGGLGTAGQGNDGGDCPGSGGGGGGGGGGADEVGAVGSIATGGKGGDGIESALIDDDTELYGAGGGGAVPVNPFGPIGGTTPGAGGAGGGGAGRGGSFGPGNPGTGIGAGGGGAIGNNPGGAGKKGRVAIKYKGRAADYIDPIDPDPPEYLGPITFAGCTRLQEVGDVEILVDCNARIDSGIYPDYQRYVCVGGGVAKSSRSMRPDSLPSQLPDDPLPGGENDVQNGTLVFRFSEPIRAFKITRRVTAGADAVPVLIACDDYTVVPHPTSAVPGSSKDGSIVNQMKVFPTLVYYPAVHYEPAQNLAAEEEMEIIHNDGFTCLVIVQPTKFPSEFIDPMFALL